MTSRKFPGKPPSTSTTVMVMMNWYGVPLLQMMPTHWDTHGSLVGIDMSVMLGTVPLCLHTSGQNVKLYRSAIWVGSVGFLDGSCKIEG
jgi:hypothetical protein